MDILKVKHWFGVYLRPPWPTEILKAQDDTFNLMDGLLDEEECRRDFGYYLSQVAIEVECRLYPEGWDGGRLLEVFDVIDPWGHSTYAVSLQSHQLELGFRVQLDDPEFEEVTPDHIQNFITFFDLLGVNPLEVYTSRFLADVKFPAQWHYTQSYECYRQN